MPKLPKFQHKLAVSRKPPSCGKSANFGDFGNFGNFGNYTEDSLCPSFSFFVCRYRRVCSEGGISSGSHSETDKL